MLTAAMPTGSEVLPGLPIAISPLGGEEAPRTLLVKFYFTNEGLVPHGIPLKEPRLSDLTQKIVRESSGMEDGIQIVKDLPDVTISDLRQGLARSRFRLVDVHYYRQDRAHRGIKKPRLIVNMSFEKTTDERLALALPTETENAIRALAATTWGTAHVYWNAHGVDSILLLGRKPDVPARHEIVARVGVLQAVAAA